MTYHAKVVAGGKMVIPAELRRALGIKDGDSLVVELEPNVGLIIKTYEQVVHDVQERFRALRSPDDGVSLVNELIAEREAEARREHAEYESWLASNP